MSVRRERAEGVGYLAGGSGSRFAPFVRMYSLAAMLYVQLWTSGRCCQTRNKCPLLPAWVGRLFYLQIARRYGLIRLRVNVDCIFFVAVRRITRKGGFPFSSLITSCTCLSIQLQLFFCSIQRHKPCSLFLPHRDRTTSLRDTATGVGVYETRHAVVLVWYFDHGLLFRVDSRGNSPWQRRRCWRGSGMMRQISSGCVTLWLRLKMVACALYTTVQPYHTLLIVFVGQPYHTCSTPPPIWKCSPRKERRYLSALPAICNRKGQARLRHDEVDQHNNSTVQ